MRSMKKYYLSSFIYLGGAITASIELTLEDCIQYAETHNLTLYRRTKSS